ncbi:MAG: 4-(cytidine 5'-diphospho)-2-C-methyl-D-erythritol kinase [Rhodobacter sp.]|nr:4-(cytidine 5'-diphospho)-2-C-methyl-D-erythritol kinase [Rhodobacter sp.]
MAGQTRDAVAAFAPAKINLTLHVTGRRDDGYHLLDSLVVFADVGDRVLVRPASDTSLTVTGPRAAGVPADASNLVLRAADWLGTPPAAITLDKHLPAAAGLGGGSSDAAATLRALAACFGRDLLDPAATAALGADVPVCLRARPCRMTGIGERLADVPDLPPLHFTLVNPGVAVSTAEVFTKLASAQNRPMPTDLPNWPTTEDLAAWLPHQTNDLEHPARQIAPAIGVALARLDRTEGCLLARMSGSGATCFGLYATRTEAEAAATVLSTLHPDWWIAAASDWQKVDAARQPEP